MNSEKTSEEAQIRARHGITGGNFPKTRRNRLLVAWFFVPLHRFLFRLSGGRVLNRLEGGGVLILVAKGRKSGKRRSSPLLYFRFEDSGDLIVVASNYGQDHHPAWYLNIAADPNVLVETSGECFAAEARITQGEERTALFDRVVEANPRFANYRAGTHRQIPIVALRRTQPSVWEAGCGGRKFSLEYLRHMCSGRGEASRHDSRGA